MRLVCLLFLLPLMLAFGAELPPDFDEVRRGGAIREAFAGETIRLVCWNIERGQQFAAVGSALELLSGDLLLLQEVDLNARRSGNRNIAAEYAGRLGHDFAFAPEFLELGQRVGGADALHGQATLSRLPIKRARLIRHREQDPSWRPSRFLPRWGIFQPRYGGRVALVTEHETPRGLLVAYNLHLESRGPESLRLAQMREVLEDARRYPRNTAILIAGDLNTKRAHSPVLEAPVEAGFTAILGGEITTKRGQPLDWIFLRGPFTTSGGRVHSHIRASDHYPLTVTLIPKP